MTQDGAVFAWGSNLRGQLGVGPQLTKAASPHRVFELTATRVAAGAFHTLACTPDGQLFAWGSNHFGQLGVDAVGSNLFRPHPVSIPSVLVCDVSCGPDSSLAVSSAGVAYVWGMLMGPGCDSHQPHPRRVDQAWTANLFVSRVGMGKLHLALLADTALTKLLRNAVAAIGGRVDMPLGQVKRDLLSMPSHANSIQTRAQQWLSEASEGALPFFSLDKCVVRVVPDWKGREGAVVTTRVVTVFNHSNSLLDVSLIMPGPERYQTSRVAIDAEPSCFTLERFSQQTVYVTVTCHSPPLEDLHALFYFEAKRLKSPERSRFFLLAHIERGSQEALDDPFGLRQGSGVEQVKVDAAASYVPLMIRRRFEVDPTPLTTPVEEVFRGAILFIDISGFTALNERLSKLGQGGPEQVSKHLNTYFGQLIEVVVAAGGDVLKFAGDALICLFGAPPDKASAEPPPSVDEIARRAVQCGLTIQRELATYDSQAGFTLTLHIGVGVGTLHALWLGGVDSAWEFLVIGDPFLQLRSVVDESKTGEVVVSSQCWSLVEAHFQGQRRGTENVLVLAAKATSDIPTASPQRALGNSMVQPRKRYPPEMLLALRGYLPLAVQTKLDAIQMGWTAELRRVTTLFCLLSSLTYDPSVPLDVNWLHETLRVMQAVVFRTEGTVRQFLVDDKGAVLIAVYGVPPFAHEDDELRGVKAALEIHNVLLQRGMHNSVGVTTGDVFCGSVGSSHRQEYAVVGDTVNLAARLMVAASKANGGGVLCDEQTSARVPSMKFSAQAPILVKGKSEPVAVFRPEGLLSEQQVAERRDMQQRNLRQISTLGRNFEKEALEEALDQLLRDGTPRAVVIEGPPGIGKSKLAAHIMEMAEAEQVVVLQGTCTALEKGAQCFLQRRAEL